MASTEQGQLSVQRELFLRTLSGARPRGHVAQQLVRCMREVSFSAGDTIFREGQITGLIHFIRTGDVELRTEGAPPWRLVAPSVIGILDALKRRPHRRTAVALTDLEALSLREEDWLDILEESFDFARESMERVASDLHTLHLSVAPGGGFPTPPPGEVDPAPHVLNLLERTLVLRAVAAFRAGTVEALANLARLSSERSLDPGEVLFRRGDSCDVLWVPASGIIRAEREDPTIVARFGPSAIVGGAAVIGLTEEPYTAHAETHAQVILVRREDLFDIAEDHFDLARAIFAGLADEREQVVDLRTRREAEGEKLPQLPTVVGEPPRRAAAREA